MSSCAKNECRPKVFISVVSHGHGELISSIGCLSKLSSVFTVVVKNNCPDDVLTSFSGDHEIILLDEGYYQGFGFNNNAVFDYCIKRLGMKPDDYFLVLNPDVNISAVTIESLIDLLVHDRTDVAAINLYKDDHLTLYDNSIRRFPSLGDFFSSFFLGLNKSIIDKSVVIEPICIDWCAGSFMAIKSSVYSAISGFDINYFMYCEDIDFCLRVKRAGYNIMYYPMVKAVHLASHGNRAVFSRHFFWHLKSIIRYLFVKHGYLNSKSNLL